MKTLALVVKQINNLIVRNKLFSCIFITSFIISAISFCFMYAYALSLMKAGIEKDMERRKIILSINKEHQNTVLIDDIYAKYQLGIEEICIYAKPIWIEVKNAASQEIQIVSYLPKYQYGILRYGRNFTEEELREGHKVAILNISYANLDQLYANLDSYIYINENNYQIVGVRFATEDKILVEIPYLSLKNENTSVSAIAIVFSLEFYKDIEVRLEEIIESLEIDKKGYEILANPINKKEERLFIQRVLQAIFIVSLAVISMMLIYSYFIEIRKREFAVMRIIGASENTILKLIYFELLLILFLAYIIAVVVNTFVLIPLLHSLDIYPIYRVIDYIIVFILLFCIASIPVLPVLFRSLYFSPVKNRLKSLE